MFKYLNTIPNWALGIGFLIIIIGLIILFLLIIKKGLIIKNKWFSIEKNNFNPEAFILIFKESLRVDKEICKIEYRNRMKEQMSYVDDEIKEIKEQIVKVHRHLLQAQGISVLNSENHVQIQILSGLIDNILFNIKSDVRDRFSEMRSLFDIKENTKDDYNFIKSDFEEYYKRIYETLVQDCKNDMKNRWISFRGEKINKRQSWESVEKLFKDDGSISKVIKEIFLHAIEVQLKYSKKIKELQDEIDAYIKKVTHIEK
jgi:hypothetical protein